MEKGKGSQSPGQTRQAQWPQNSRVRARSGVEWEEQEEGLAAL